MKWQRDGFEVDTDPARMDLRVVHDFIANRSYWARNIPFDTFERSVTHALCFGVYAGDRIIGFARLITDRATIAYLGDVFIHEGFRGKGLSKWLMDCITAHPELQGLRRWILATQDAHGLYEQYGFRSLAAPERFMEKCPPIPYG
ncbi:GNAT family N-acetyltransferase [Chitinivorax sp. B]|uniref:GNAT family N-acetyltransferase n=1 Tax=Chitinivorax sp. B TaxID=2502235 RepID=UPI00201790CC|nr:GNAT family N-acetyltransferase [Chitinivorax sp. B]